MTWSRIADLLTEEISSALVREGQRIPSGDEVAERWGVTKHTAHRAIQELQRKGLVVRQRRWGTVVAGKSNAATKRIALILDRFAISVNYPNANMLQGIQEEFGPDYSLQVCDSADDPTREIDWLEKMADETDGILIFPSLEPSTIPVLERMLERQVPIVFLDRAPGHSAAQAVLFANHEGMASAVDCLVSEGHRRIGFLSFHKPEFQAVVERYEGYRDTLIRNGIDPNPDWERFLSRDLENHQPTRCVRAIQDALIALMTSPDPITAIVCTQDAICAGVFDAADRQGISIPNELSVATFNDWPPMMLRQPWRVHRITKQHFEAGALAARKLLSLIEGTEVESERITRVRAELIANDPDALLGVTFPPAIPV